MRETNSSQAKPPDALAKVIRAAGRRAPPPKEHYDQVFAATREAWQRNVRGRRQKRRLAFAASVAAALLATGAIVQHLRMTDFTIAARIVLAHGRLESGSDDANSRQDVGAGAELAPGTRLRTADQSRAALMPVGGGSIRLDVNTEVIVGLDRYELVSGRLYFDSLGRMPGNPIEVSTPIGVVRDIGTQFEVATRDESIRVRVRSGRVAITESRTNAELEASAGRQIAISSAGDATPAAFAPDDAEWGWVQSLATVPSSRSILSYLTWIARETGKRLRFDPRYVETLAEARELYADPAGYTPMQVLGLIEQTTDFRYELSDDGTILIRRLDPQ